MAGLAGRDHEARPLRVGQIIEAAKAWAVRAGERLVGRRFEPATAVEGVKAAAGWRAEIAEPVEQRHVAEDLVLQQRLVFRAPAPLAHVRAVALDEQREALVKRPPERLTAIRVGFARRDRSFIKQKTACLPR